MLRSAIFILISAATFTGSPALERNQLTCLAPILDSIDPDAPDDLNQAFVFGPWKKPVLREGVGTVDFPYSGISADLFNQGMALWHLFAYQNAERCFRACMTDDPTHPMPYWGLALANERRPKRAAFFAREAGKRSHTGVNLSETEREWLKLVTDFYKNDDAGAMVRELERMAFAHPDNVEIVAALLRRVVVNHHWNGAPIASHYANNLLADRIAKLAPKHPSRHYRLFLWLNQDATVAAPFAPDVPLPAPNLAQSWWYPAETFRVLGETEHALTFRAQGLKLALSGSGPMPDETEDLVSSFAAYVEDLTAAGRYIEARDAARELTGMPRTFYREKRHSFAQRQAGSFATGRRLLGQLHVRLEMWPPLLKECQSGMLSPVPEDPETKLESLFWQEMACRHLGDHEKAGAIAQVLKSANEKEFLKHLAQIHSQALSGREVRHGESEKFTVEKIHWAPAPAPDFSLPDETGTMRSLKDYAGTPVILNFFLGAGCGFCRQQMDKFTPVLPLFEKSGIQIVGISSDDLPTLQTVIDSYKKASSGADSLYAFPVLSDAKACAFKAFEVFEEFQDRPLHGTILLDSSGRILWRNIGHEPFNHPTQLHREAERLLRIHDPQSP